MKRRLAIFLKALGSALVLLILVLVGGCISASIPKTDSFFVRDAKFSTVEFNNHSRERATHASESPPTKPQYHVQNHWISEGRGTVFGWRYYSNGSLMTMDDEIYRKITIWVAEIPAGEIAFGDKSKVVGYYSQGGSAWPGAGCGGEIASGTIHLIDQAESKVRIKIAGSVDCINQMRKKSERVDLDDTFSFERIEHPEITPWFGKPGENIYRETYRR